MLRFLLPSVFCVQGLWVVTLYDTEYQMSNKLPRIDPAGGHQFSATYNGKQNFVTSVSSNVPYTVGALNTTTELDVDHNPQVFGQNVTFTGDAAGCFSCSAVLRQANTVRTSYVMTSLSSHHARQMSPATCIA